MKQVQSFIIVLLGILLSCGERPEHSNISGYWLTSRQYSAGFENVRSIEVTTIVFNTDSSGTFQNLTYDFETKSFGEKPFPETTFKLTRQALGSVDLNITPGHLIMPFDVHISVSQDTLILDYDIGIRDTLIRFHDR